MAPPSAAIWPFDFLPSLSLVFPLNQSINPSSAPSPATSAQFWLPDGSPFPFDPAQLPAGRRHIWIDPAGGDDAASLLKMLDLLDDCDDIQQVHHNANIDRAALEAYADS